MMATITQTAPIQQFSSVKVIKNPAIIHKDDKGKRVSLYSASFHPSRTVLATGGIDSLVKLWDLSPSDKQQSVDLVSTLSLHNGAVLCVRFSPDGKFLASSSDGDNIIIIWEPSLEQYNNGRVFGSTSVNKESWKCRIRLNKHISDVVDLSWSQNGQYLASCGLDGKVVVWDTEIWQAARIINGHSNFVKGVFWDPLNMFLCSASDDGSVALWDAISGRFDLVSRVKGPFKRGFSNGFFRRGCWSPDGSNFCAVQANDESGLVNAISVIKRPVDLSNENETSLWEEEASLIGHKYASECCSFNPWLFKSTASSETYWVLAVGSQDGSVSFWQANKSRPILVIENLYETSGIFDIGWCYDGSVLFCVGGDGVVTLISIGLTSQSNKGSLSYKIFQDSDSSSFVKTSSFSRQVQQDPPSAGLYTPLGIIVDKLTLEDKIKTVFGDTSQKDGEQNQLSALQEYPELRHFSNREMNDTEMNDALAPSIAQPNRLERLELILEGGSQTTAFTTAQFQPGTNQTQVQSSQVLAQQKVSITKDGKKRVQPIVMSSPQKQALAPSSLNQNQNGSFTHHVSSSNRKIEKHIVADDPLSLETPQLVPVLKLEQTQSGQKITVTADQATRRGVTKVSFKHPELIKSWVDYVPSPVLQFNVNDKMVIACLSDASLIVWSLGGWRSMPVLKCDSIVHQIFVSNGYICYISKKGSIWLWDIDKRKVILDGISIVSLLSNYNQQLNQNDQYSISTVDISLFGKVFVHLSNYQIFTYDLDMQTWAEVNSQTQFDQIMIEPSTHAENTPESVFQSKMEDFFQNQKSTVYRTDEIRSSAQLAKLEQEIHRSLALKDIILFKATVLSYSELLGKVSQLALSKTNELCRMLLFDSSLGDAGISGLEIFNHILPKLASNNYLQPLLNLYKNKVLTKDDSFFTANTLN